MKLRNKKDGEVYAVKLDGDYSGGASSLEELPVTAYWRSRHTLPCSRAYRSLHDLLEDWEDAPKEPLLEDWDVRLAVRKWAEAAGIDTVTYEASHCALRNGFVPNSSIINFRERYIGENLEDGKEYTIDELCGVEDES